MEKDIWRQIQFLNWVNYLDEINLAVIRETFGKVVYTHKTYEKAADICVNKSRRIKWINVILLSLTSGSALGSVVNGQIFLVITSILSTLALFYMIYQLSFDFNGLEQKYRLIARRLWLIREKYQNLVADIMNERYDPVEIAERRDTLLLELNDILKDAPPTDEKAYSKARSALRIGEEMTFNGNEIDNFLPEKLRIG